MIKSKHTWEDLLFKFESLFINCIGDAIIDVVRCGAFPTACRYSCDCVWSSKWIDWFDKRSGKILFWLLILINSSCVQFISFNESSKSASSSKSESFRANSFNFSTTATNS